MPHPTSSTRNDYEQKIKYDWPKHQLHKMVKHTQTIRRMLGDELLECV